MTRTPSLGFREHLSGLGRLGRRLACRWQLWIPVDEGLKERPAEKSLTCILFKLAPSPKDLLTMSSDGLPFCCGYL